jgi:hypothetical protein
MRGSSRTMIGGSLGVVAVAGAMAIGVVGQAGAGEPKGGGPATVKATLDGRKLAFTGADEVREGGRLVFVNRTDPEQVGPHTFSLVRKSEVPQTGKQRRRCFRGDNVCARIAQAHRFEPPGTINRPDVDRGAEGWDKRFGRSGDTYYTEKRGDAEGREVAVDGGGNLWFMCAVHPEMVRRVHVTD